MPVEGGYGEGPYGHGSYGNVDIILTEISSVISLDGFRVEVFFSTPMKENTNLLTASLYTLAVDSFAALCEVLSVAKNDENDVGVLSVILTHSGTTLGGRYITAASTIEDTIGNVISSVTVTFAALGSPPVYSVLAPDGDTLVARFEQDMLPIAEHPTATNIGTLSSYEVTEASGYPIAIELQSVDYPYQGNVREVGITVDKMTSLDYEMIISPATAFDYPCTVVPASFSGFNAVEYVSGTTGVTTVVGSADIQFDVPTGGLWGYEFQDTSNILEAGGSFYWELAYNENGSINLAASTGTEYEALVLQVSPGGPSADAVRVDFVVDADGATTYLRLVDPATNANVGQITFDWTGSHTLVLAYNAKVASVTLLLDGSVRLTVSSALFGNPSLSAAVTVEGVTAVFDANAAWSGTIDGFRFGNMRIQSSNTVYSAAWNFLFDHTIAFTGSPANARGTVPTQKGPIVKGWGDGTPATAADVAVRVQGVSVGIESVNPYIGYITLDVPVPYLPPGDIDVKVDYKWMATPQFSMLLDTEGLVLDQYDRAVSDDTETYYDGGFGAISPVRFPMATVLEGVERQKPKYIGHRYIGFEREYSALLDSPTTMLLDQPNNRTAVPGFDQHTEGVSVAYEGILDPTEDEWDLNGTDFGAADVGQGTWTVIDGRASEGYLPGDDNAAVYYRALDTTFPASMFLVGRFQIPEDESLFDGDTPDDATISMRTTNGVFTGVGFGMHDTVNLYLVGALLINDVQHVGILSDATQPQNREAWIIGPEVEMELSSQDTATTATSSLPADVRAGDRFQIFEGNQTGVYTLESVVAQTDGTSTLTITGEFPVGWNTFGSKYPTAYIEMPFLAADDVDAPTTYRLEVRPDTQTAVLMLSGENTATVTSLIGAAPELPPPADSALLFDPEFGQVFWGSLDRLAANRTKWSFFRYGVIPDLSTVRGHVVNLFTEMDELPDTSDWYRTQSFGEASVASGLLSLRSNIANTASAYAFGYGRLEPFFERDGILDLSARFRVERGTYAGDAQIIINDSLREIRLGTLLYLEGFTGHDWRQLLHLPSVSMAGGETLETQTDWSLTSGGIQDPLVYTTQAFTTTLSGSHTQKGNWGATVDVQGLSYNVDTGGRVFEAVFNVSENTPNAAGDTGIEMAFEVGDGTKRLVIAQLRNNGVTPGIRLLTAGYVTIQDYAFDWTVGGGTSPVADVFHSLRLIADEPSTSLLVYGDDALLGTVDLTLFNGGSSSTAVRFGVPGFDSSGVEDLTTTAVVLWKAVSFAAMAPVAAKRTLGVWRGGDGAFSYDINNWEIPRTDNSNSPNSWQLGPVIEEMDWRSYMEVRILHDPSWGVTVYRPDLPFPPYYVDERTTQINNPSEGWINVEYPRIPKSEDVFGRVEFGALERLAITSQTWDYVRYRLTSHILDDLTAPQGMLLDRYNVITSGELKKDITLEQVIVATMDSRRVSLLPTDIYAAHVYKVIDGETVFLEDTWIFDSVSQTLTLQPDSDGVERTFSDDHAPVTIVFVPGSPVTKTYLETQPLLDGITKLNEGTPPYPKSQIGSSTTTTVGSTILESVAASISDPFETTVHVDPEGTYYEDLEFIEVDDGGQTDILSIACDGSSVIPGGFTGFTTNEGEDIYDVGGGGAALGWVGNSAGLTATGDKVGKTVGGLVFEFKGTAYHESQPLGPKDWPFAAAQTVGSVSPYLFVQGGNFLTAGVVGGVLTGPNPSIPAGNTLGPTPAALSPLPILFPVGPAAPGPGLVGNVGPETSWALALSTVTTDGTGVPVDQDLAEDFGITGGAQDDIPSSAGDAASSPDGPASSLGSGSAYYYMEDPAGVPVASGYLEAAN